ncbi:MAG: hypothetical protein JWM68_4854 [Verrucomicrobiales bacterium]|nr:hypothetical protein [Verrucomicrobiales bacterium]
MILVLPRSGNLPKAPEGWRSPGRYRAGGRGNLCLKPPFFLLSPLKTKKPSKKLRVFYAFFRGFCK